MRRGAAFLVGGNVIIAGLVAAEKVAHASRLVRGCATGGSTHHGQYPRPDGEMGPLSSGGLIERD
jgi:hypothetical protein